MPIQSAQQTLNRRLLYPGSWPGVPDSRTRTGVQRGALEKPQLSEGSIWDFRRLPGWKFFPAVLKRPAAPPNSLCESEG